MRVKCLNIKWMFAIPLTVGNVYEVINEENEYFTIVDDSGNESKYNKERFLITDEPLTK